MTSEQKIVMGMLLAILIGVNPILIKFIFAHFGFYFNTTLWISNVLLLIIIYKTAIRSTSLKRSWVNVITSMFSIMMVFYLLVCIDRLLISKLEFGLIYPKNTEIRYLTSEFDIVARINNLGLRDRHAEILKSNKFRVLVYGDSFTFGWGVELEDSWIKKTEENLRNNQVDIEVLNCGQSGKFSKDYADNAEKTIPLLKPDFVIIGMLQGNDLYQAMNHVSPPPDRALWN